MTVTYTIRNAVTGEFLLMTYSEVAAATMRASFTRYGTRTYVEVGTEVL